MGDLGGVGPLMPPSDWQEPVAYMATGTSEAPAYDTTSVGRRLLVKKNNTGGGRGCFGRRPTWDRKQRWMGNELVR